MSEPGSVVVPLGVEENLGLVLEPPEGLGVDDAIYIPLEACANLTFRLGPRTALRLGRLDSEGREGLGL